MALLDDVKTALRRTVEDTALDAEIQLNINAAFQDLGFAGVIDRETIEEEPIVMKAVILYCMAQANIGTSNYDSIKKAYDEHKAQLGTATGFTDWGAIE